MDDILKAVYIIANRGRNGTDEDMTFALECIVEMLTPEKVKDE